jgi:hypothetical protein
MTEKATDIIAAWPQESREAAKLVVDEHGEPDEATPSRLIWYDRSPWRSIVAMREFAQHDFPVPHIDAVESSIDYRVPVEKVSELAEFDGSVTVKRTEGILSARCHDLMANNLALNLTHDIVTGAKSVTEAREYYGYEFLAWRRHDPTPYMQMLRVPRDEKAADEDVRTLSDKELHAATAEGRRKGQAA